MKKMVKVIFIFLVIAGFYPIFAQAATIEDLQKQFISFGGTEEGFNKIIDVVKQAQAANQTLQLKIKNVYNPELQTAMMATPFNMLQYGNIINQIEQDKALLVQKDINAMSVLLNSLSPADRKAYGILLYGNLPVSNTNNIEAPATSNQGNQNNNLINQSPNNNMPNNLPAINNDMLNNLPSNTSTLPSNTSTPQAAPQNSPSTLPDNNKSLNTIPNTTMPNTMPKTMPNSGSAAEPLGVNNFPSDEESNPGLANNNTSDNSTSDNSNTQQNNPSGASRYLSKPKYVNNSAM